jgi:glycosyltransferase involved in cell wall biosynthesis
MSTSPEFSIITVCLNEGPTIRRTCVSICSQTFSDFEWIVIDGGSADETLDVLENFRDRITRLVSEPDDGIYDAMNKGARLAAGKYLVFLNAGDLFFDDEVLQTVAKAPDADLVFGDVVFCCENGGQRRQNFPDRLNKYFMLKNMLAHQASFFDRAVFLQYGGYDPSFRIAGDYDLFVRLLCVHRASVFHIPHPLAIFYKDGISSDRSFRMLRKTENHRIRKEYFPWFVYGLKGLRMEARLLIRKLRPCVQGGS